MKEILVTGGAGFVPSHLVNRLAENKDNRIVVLDNLLTGKQSNLPRKANVRFEKGDANSLSVLEKIFDARQFDYVFHYAAVVGVKRTLANPLMVLDDIDGFKHLLKLSADQSVKRVFFSSSSEVYGESPSFPQNEDTTPLNSRLPYAVVKSVGEVYLRAYKLEREMDYTIFRFFNTYGPGQSPDFVMSKFIKAALRNQPLTVYGDGSQTRTFCFVKDNIDACMRAFEDNQLVNETANIGSDIEITILELAKTVIKVSDSKSTIKHLPPLKEGDMSRRLPDVSKMKKLLSRSFTPLEEGVKLTIEAMRKHG